MQVYAQAGSIVYETDELLKSRPEEKTPPPTEWVVVAREEDIPEDGGAAIKYGASQIAIFNFKSRGEWYACQNMCPHKNSLVLSRGIIGDAGGDPKLSH